MGKLVGIILIIAIIAVGLHYGAQTFTQVAGPARSSYKGPINSMGSIVPLRPYFDAACKAHGSTIVVYKELKPEYYQLVVRGPDRNSVNEWLEDLTWPSANNIIKDVDLNKTKYWQAIENGTGVFYASYELRAWK